MKEYNVNEFIEYSVNFKRGYNENIYCNATNVPDTETVDFSNMSSVGYYDGCCYAKYVVDTFQTMSISSEQLIAEIDKRYTNALKKCNELEEETSKSLR